MQKAVNAEAKADLRSSIMVRDADSRCPRGHRLSQNTSTKVQTQGSTAKESKSEESRLKDSKMADKKTPLRPALMNQGRLPAKISRKSILKRSGIGKTLFRLQETTPWKVRRSGTIEVTKSAIIVKKKAILLGIVRNLQKTSVGLGNLCTGD